MMNYDAFKKEVEEKFKEYLPEQYRNMDLRISPVLKVNRVLDGINLVKNEGTRSVSPTIYINDMYDRYLNTENLQAVLQDAAESMEKAFADMPEVADLSLGGAKDNIVFQVVNTVQNKEMLSGIPHREFQDLSIIYRWVVAVDEKGIQSTIIRDDMVKQLGMNENQLFQCAAENTKRILPPVIRSMNDVLRDMYISNGMPEETVSEVIGEIPADQMMYIISNDRGINGAVSMLYEDNLHKLAEKLETDLYILPSSVHECIAVSAEMGNPYELAEMVNEINMSQVDLQDRLSNQVYFYDRGIRKISMATDTPNKYLNAPGD